MKKYEGMEQYSRGRRGRPAKALGRVTGAEVQILSAPPLKKINPIRDFFNEFIYF